MFFFIKNCFKHWHDLYIYMMATFWVKRTDKVNTELLDDDDKTKLNKVIH